MKKMLSMSLAAGIAMTSLVPYHAMATSNETTPIISQENFQSGSLLQQYGASAEQLVLQYIEKNKAKIGWISQRASDVLQVESIKTDELGFTVVKFNQTYEGFPVFGATLIGHVRNGVLTSISGELIPELRGRNIANQVSFDVNDAALIAEYDLISREVGAEPVYNTADQKDVETFVYLNNKGKAALAYQVNFNFLSPVPGNWFYYIDARTGEILNKYNTLHNVTGTNTVGSGKGVLGATKSINTTYSGGLYYLQDNTRGKGIFTYNAKNRTSLPGSLWSDTDNVLNTVIDAPAVDAHVHAGITYDYYKNIHGRLSFDNNNAPLKSTVHYSSRYNNAFWNGSQMVYGDGDGTTFRPLSGSLDVVAHELTHAVTEYSAGLVYQNESGAINESMSDIFGTLVEYYANDNPDWEMGEDVYTPATPGDALRSMSNPAKYNDPDHYSKRYTGTEDNGGVHINSSISNKAAYLLSEGGTHYGVTVMGIGTQKVGKIFYRALTSYLTANSNFKQLRAAAIQSAIDLYGSTSIEVAQTVKAFDAVGIK